MGILPSDSAACATYWPSSFDVGGNVEKDVALMGYDMEDIVELDLRILEMGKAEVRGGRSAVRDEENNGTLCL